MKILLLVLLLLVGCAEKSATLFDNSNGTEIIDIEIKLTDTEKGPLCYASGIEERLRCTEITLKNGTKININCWDDLVLRWHCINRSDIESIVRN